jgi:homeobox-leucine zipper protein
MAQEDVHLSDAGLALGLSLGSGGASSEPPHHSRPRRASPCPLEPSLTLSMPDEATATASGGGAHSVSSLSVAGSGVKRERVEEAETAERASSTATLRSGAEDDDDGSTRKKLRLTKEQSALLEDRFKEHSTLNPVSTTSGPHDWIDLCVAAAPHTLAYLSDYCLISVHGCIH